MNEPDSSAQAVQKYKTVAKAVAANDVEAARLIHQVFVDQGKKLSETDVNMLAHRWLMGQEYPVAKADFLAEIGFDFNQHAHRDKDDAVGDLMPFLMIGKDEDEKLLKHLIQNKHVKLGLKDGGGDGLLVAALANERLDLADWLRTQGVDLDATNIAGRTALHTFAARADVVAIDWLARHGANPDIDDLKRNRASELVPELVGMDAELGETIYNTLEDYVDAFAKGQPFAPSEAFQAAVTEETARRNPPPAPPPATPGSVTFTF